MIGTFSYNPGDITEAINYPVEYYLSLTASVTQESDLMYSLRDNEEKLINPISLRNSILSLWTSIPFKETKINNISYIGVDTLYPGDNDLKKTIFIGKRSYSGTYSYDNSYDIMNTNLLNSNVDIFLYNTKKDTVSNTITRMVLLAGNKPSLHISSPFIQSQKVVGLTESLSIDFVSKSGDLNVGNPIPNNNLNGTTASFSLNGVILPTIDENFNGSTYSSILNDNKVLYYDNGRYVWDEITLPSVNTIGVTGSELEILGTPVNVNGYSLELNDSRYTPISIGGISMGQTFSNLPIVEVLRSLIYTYLGPLCTITIDNKYSEVGTYPTPQLTYTITKRTKNTEITNLNNMLPGFYPAITNSGQVTITGVSTGLVGKIDTSETYFTITVKDIIGTTQSSVASIKGIYPYFYGFSSLSIITNQELFNLTKSIEYKSDKLIDISGYGNYYFIYDSNYGLLSEILDDYGNNIISSFSYSIKTLSNGPWALKTFYVYQLDNVSQVGPPSINYEFKY